jgi:hypothetical protein
VRSYLILAMCGLFLIEYFVHSQWLEYAVVVIALAAFGGSVTRAHPMPRAFGIAMMVLGIILELSKGAGIKGICQGISMNLPLITLVILVPLLSLPLKLGGYFDAIDSTLRRLKHHPRKLFAGITSVLFLLGPIMNLGSLRIVDELLREHKLPPMMLAKSYLVGFSTTMLWSPYYASVSLVLYYLQVPVAEYMVYGIGLALLFFLTGNLLFGLWANHHPIQTEPTFDETTIDNKRKLIRLGMIVIGIMSSTFLVEFFTHWSMLVIVSLLSVAFPLLWGALSREWDRMAPQLVDFRDKAVPIMNNEIVLFTSAGLLGNAMQGTSIGHGIKWLLNSLAHQSFLLFAFAVISIIVVVTFIGVHQIVVVTALVTQMNPQELGTNNHVLAMLLMLAWSISSVLSPVNPLNLLVSRLSGTTSIETGIRANGLHLSIVTVLGLIVLTIIH